MDTIVTTFLILTNNTAYHQLVANDNHIPIHEITDIINRYNHIIAIIRSGMITNSYSSLSQEPQSWITTH